MSSHSVAFEHACTSIEKEGLELLFPICPVRLFPSVISGPDGSKIMKQKALKRIAIIGLPGSGKSTFAIRLGILNIPVHHLDKHLFNGRKKRDLEEFLTINNLLLKGDVWIIEGCSFSTLEKRFFRANTVIYLHFPRLLCL